MSTIVPFTERRPVLARRIAYTIRYSPLFLVLLAIGAWANRPHGDKAQYQSYQQEIASWEATVHSDSVKLVALDAAIRDSAEATLGRLTEAQVKAQHERFGQIIFAPEAMLTEQAETRDHLAWARREAQKARLTLYRWLNENGADARDTLGVRHR